MTVKQLVLGVKNQPGEIARIIGHLYENDINVPAFWVGMEDRKATLRFIASDPKAAVPVLTGLGHKVEMIDVIAARIPNHPGGLNTILKLIQAAKINILHIYSFLEATEPVLILEVDRTQEAVRVLQNHWITLYDEKVYHL